jgi:poly(hydroxyalkanoate) depolymerase family esterase
MRRDVGTRVAAPARMRRLLLCTFAAGCSLGGAPGGSKPSGDDAPPTGGDDEPPTGDGGTEPAQGITCTDATGVSGIAKVIECAPAGMEGKTGAPAALVVALHGYTQTADEYRLTTEWDKLAARYKFYVVFPQTNADVVNAGGRPAAWKWWKDFGDFTRTSFNQHYKPIQDVVTRMKAAHDIDPDRVFITGLSAGGYMTSLMLACFPDVFAAGAVFSGGPTDCDLKCTDSNKQQDWTRPAGYHVPNAADLKASYPTWWNDATKRKPRVIAFHGGLDQAVKPVNLDDVMRQWTGALGIDTTPDNAALGLPTTLGGYAYKAYAQNGKAAVATVLMPDLGHGSPVKPGTGATEGGSDPYPTQVAADCSNVSDPTCKQDWTNTGGVYGAYHAAVFFGLI